VAGGKYMYMGKLPVSNGSTHITKVTHWFDASQVYGSDEAKARALRTDAGSGPYLRMDGDFLPTIDAKGEQVFLTGDTPRSSLHIGSLMMHHLWAKEHNKVVDGLKKHYGDMTDEELFQTARLIVAAEIVKVHSVEWTAQLVGDPISYEFFQRFWKEFGKQAYRKDLYYAVSEEFISSYILHEIVPPQFDLVDKDGKTVERVDFVKELFLIHGQNQLKKHGVPNVLNAFGLNPMGLIMPFNVSPTFRRFEGLNFITGAGHENLIHSVQQNKAADSGRLLPADNPEDRASYVDLGALSVARDRDARVPFYNDMRERLCIPRLKSIGEISNDPKVVETLESLYKGDVNKIEYIVGYKAESRPSNWALTPTQVRTFLPVVIYRILADRFYTENFNAATYTQYGMDRLADIRLYDIIKECYGPSMLPPDRDHPIFHQWNK
jgi:hypothetical protein